jgi:hypothetical protein
MSDPTRGPDPNGQPPANVQPPVGTVANAPNSAFLEYEWENGKKETFKTKEDTLRYLREGTLRHQDYTKKTQELAKQREKQSEREKQIEAMLADITAKKAKIDPMDEFLTKRKDIADYIASQMREPSPQVQEDQFKKLIEQYTKPLQDKLTEAETWRKGQEENRQWEEIHGTLGKQYPDFNKDTVEQMLQDLRETPEGEENRALAEMAYWAAKGKTSPVPKPAQPKSTERLSKISPVPSQGASPPPASTGTPASIRAAVDAYKQAHPD